MKTSKRSDSGYKKAHRGPISLPMKKHSALQSSSPEILFYPADSGHLVHPVDIWVNDYFTKNKIKWKAPVDDRTYLRRIFLDIIGPAAYPRKNYRLLKKIKIR